MKKKVKGDVCYPCGVSANVLTCLKKYKAPPLQLYYSLSTLHTGTCACCGKVTSLTQQRDFFNPSFDLLLKAMGKHEKENS